MFLLIPLFSIREIPVYKIWEMSDDPNVAFKTFSGDGDQKDRYQKFKKWAMAQMATKDKLTKDNRGSFLYTLLVGTALESVDHLPFTEFGKEGGEDKLWALLDSARSRWTSWESSWMPSSTSRARTART